MPTIVLIEKTGEIKENNIKNLKVADIYKKCNFRKKDDFDMRYTWNINKDLFISVFSRNDGKSGTENKYDLPPPIDKDLYFGSIAIVAHKSKKISDNNIIDFSKELWNKTYEKLMGGFEDLNGEDSYSEEEEIPEDLKTSQGYMKDGFVVDDDEEDDHDHDDDDEDEDDDEEDTILTSEECDEDDDEDIDDHENIDDDEDIDEEGIDEEDIDEEDIDEEDIDDEDVGDEDGIDEEDEDGENEDGEGIYKTNFKIKNQPQRKAKKAKKSKKTKVNLLTDISSGCDADEETNNDIHSELSEEEYQY